MSGTLAVGPDPLTVLRALGQLTVALAAAAIDDPPFEARILLEHALALDPGQCAVAADRLLGTEVRKRLNDLVALRLTGVPLQYVVGEWDFHGATYSVRPGVLIPRSDTECLARVVLEHIPATARGLAVDLGTGSGVLALTLKRLRPALEVHAIDLAGLAVDLAAENARRLGLAVTVHQGHWTPVMVTLCSVHGQASVMISNPPYISSAELRDLDASVRDHEPVLALDGGVDGLEAFRSLADLTESCLAPGGLLALEIGHTQGPTVSTLLGDRPYLTGIEVHQDLGGRDRVVVARRRSP